VLGYNVKRSLTTGGGYITIANTITGTSYTDSTVNSSTTYYYVVTAVSSSGESANSAEVAARPLAPPHAMIRLNPTGMEVVGKTLSQGTLTRPVMFPDQLPSMTSVR